MHRNGFSRRPEFIKRAAATTGLTAMAPASLRAAARVRGTDAPEREEVKVGFVALTDCASVVMTGVDVPAQPLRSARLIDGALWTGQDPARFAAAHAIHA
jgi:hypothetical protein